MYREHTFTEADNEDDGAPLSTTYGAMKNQGRVVARAGPGLRP
jgi:hypothetical protein